MEKENVNKRVQIQWINCAKAAAMIAVLVIHGFNILYTNFEVARTVDWALSLFIIITGMGSYISNSRSNLSWGKAYLKSVKKMLGAYVICSAIALVIKTEGFDVKTYLYQLIHFNASGPLYYVSLYLQLMVVSWPLVWCLQKCPKNLIGYTKEALLFLIISCIASFTANYTQILDIYGGGGKLFGGTYLVLFYLGMLMIKHGWFEQESLIKSILIWSISSVAWIFWRKKLVIFRMVIDSKVPWGEGYDCPSITIMLFAIFTLFAIYGICKILEKTEITRKIVQAGSWLGERTLYIFMLHLVILYFWLMPYIEIENIWLKRIVYMVLMIVLPLVIEYIVKTCVKWIKVLAGGIKSE